MSSLDDVDGGPGMGHVNRGASISSSIDEGGQKSAAESRVGSKKSLGGDNAEAAADKTSQASKTKNNRYTTESD